MIENNGISQQLRAFVIEKFPAAKKRGLTDELPLLESGIVDSLAVLDIVGFLEQSFNIKFDDEELTPDNFANIRCLASFVEQKRSEAEVPAK